MIGVSCPQTSHCPSQNWTWTTTRSPRWRWKTSSDIKTCRGNETTSLFLFSLSFSRKQIHTFIWTRLQESEPTIWTFSSLRLGLGFNQIKFVENGSLAHLPFVSEIHLDHNRLKKVPPGLGSLRYLRVSYRYRVRSGHFTVSSTLSWFKNCNRTSNQSASGSKSRRSKPGCETSNWRKQIFFLSR